jgi:hypothetical protein
LIGNKRSSRVRSPPPHTHHPHSQLPARPAREDLGAAHLCTPPHLCLPVPHHAVQRIIVGPHDGRPSSSLRLSHLGKGQGYTAVEVRRVRRGVSQGHPPHPASPPNTQRTASQRHQRHSPHHRSPGPWRQRGAPVLGRSPWRFHDAKTPAQGRSGSDSVGRLEMHAKGATLRECTAHPCASQHLTWNAAASLASSSFSSSPSSASL